MSTEYILICIAVMAIVTYLIRILPLVAIRKKIKNRFIRSFLYYIPCAVLGCMTFPAILYSTSSLISAAIGLAVALILAFCEKNMVIVAVASCAAVLVTELIMKFAV